MADPRPDTDSRFRALFEYSPDAIFIETRDARIVEANPAAAALLGIPRHALAGMDAMTLVPEPDRERARREFAGWFTGSLTRYEGAALRADGVEVPVEITGATILHNGEPAVILHVRDIRERKLAESHLIEREWQLGYALDQGDAVVFRRSFREDRFDFLAPGVERLTGYTAEELTPSLWDTLVEYCEFAGELADLPQGEPKHRFMSGRVSRWLSRVRIRRKQGDTRWVMDMSTLTRDDEGKPLGAIGVLLDVTEFKRAEERLRSGDARMRMLTEQLPVILWSIDRDMRFTMSEGIGLEHLGLTPGQVVGQTLQEFFHTENPEHDVLRSHASALAGKPASYEFQFNGRTYFSHVEPLHDTAGHIVGAAGVAQDISDLRRIEEQLRSTEHLDSLGVLAGGIAHDFNNLLVGIIGNAEVAKLEIPAASEAQRLLEQMRLAGMRASELCTMMLAFAGRGHIASGAVDLGQVVEETILLTRAGLSRTLTFQMQLGRDVPLLECDAAQLRQIILNLVVNAAEAIADKPGTISIETGRTSFEPGAQPATVPPIEPGAYAYIRVRDTGCGMSAETLSHIFEPFYSTKFAGRGLGLSAAIGILRRHCGGFLVETKPGDGSTFTAFLPLARAKAPAAPARKEPGPILIVDDEVTVREVTAQMLKRSGFDVNIACNGEECLAFLSSEAGRAVSAVLLDVSMPSLNGEETLRRLRAQHPALPVILMSGYDDAELVDRTRNLAPVSFLPKPFGRATLLAKVKAVLPPPA